MHHVTKFFAATLLLGAAVPAFAQGYDASVDCGGVYAAGASVPFTVRFEEQALVAHNVTVVLTATLPDGSSRTLFNGVIALGANQDKAVNRNLNLPATALAGEYTLTGDTTDGVDAVLDTCSFHVN